MFDDPESILRSLRWKEDMKVLNAFGEHVWLKPLLVDGKRIGITDCCFVSDPCDHHKKIAAIQAEAESN